MATEAWMNPPGPTPVIIKRRDAAQKTVDRFSGSTFKWSSNDCIRLAAFHARAMGYKVPMPKSGSYSNAKGALRELRKTGHPKIERLLDAYFVPIAPAFALPGDICTMPAVDGEDWPSVFIVLDNNRIFGFMGDDPEHGECRVGTPIVGRITGAWRVEPA